MAVHGNSAEGGTDGVAVSVANSGGASGDAFSNVFGTGFTYSAADAMKGTMGWKVAANAFGAGEYDLPNVTQLAFQIRIKQKALATSDCHFIRVANSGTRIFSLHIVAPGTQASRVRIDDATGTAGVYTFPTTPAHDNSQYYRIEGFIVLGSATNNGRIKVGIFAGESTTPFDTIYDVSNANLGAGLTANQLYGGKYSQTAEEYAFDGFYYDTAATDFIGIAAGPPPTVSTPAIQNVAAGAAVSVGVTASSSSSTIASYAWSYVYPTSGGPALSNANTNTVSFTAGTAGNLYMLQCVVTDGNGLTTTVQTEVRVPTSGDASLLAGGSVANVGTWSNVGGAATPGQAVSDSNDGTYIESAVLTATETSVRYRVVPMTARSTFVCTVRLETDTTGSVTPKIRVFEGNTQRQAFVSLSPAVNSSWQDYVVSLTTPSAITDWGNIYLEFAGTSP